MTATPCCRESRVRQAGLSGTYTVNIRNICIPFGSRDPGETEQFVLSSHERDVAEACGSSPPPPPPPPPASGSGFQVNASHKKPKSLCCRLKEKKTAFGQCWSCIPRYLPASEERHLAFFHWTFVFLSRALERLCSVLRCVSAPPKVIFTPRISLVDGQSDVQRSRTDRQLLSFVFLQNETVAEGSVA